MPTAADPPRAAVPGRRASAPAPAAHRPFWRRLLPVLAALAALTRVPSFLRPLWNPDEGFLATQARMLADGGVLYDTVVDRKPPLLPWLYRAAFAVFGDRSLWPLKVAAAAAVVATAALLAATARRRWGDRAGWIAGVLAVPATIGLNPEDAQAAAFGVFMLPFTAAAVWCADRRHWAAAGLAVAGACLVKQTGGAVLLPVLWLLRTSVPPGRRRGALVLLGAGAAAPVAAVALGTGWERFLFWTVTGSGPYAALGGSLLHVLGRALSNTALLAAGCAGPLLPLAAALRGRAPDRRRVLTADLWLWLGASAFAAAFGFHFFGHYFLQLVPPLVLLGVGALHLPAAGRRRAAAAGSALSCAVFLGWGVAADRTELDHARRVAAAVRAHTGPGEEVLLWGMHPEGYWFADRPPASRYLTAGLLTNYSGGREGGRVGEQHGVRGSWQTFRAELAADPPAVVVDDSRGGPYEPARTPTLRSFLDRHYEPVDRVDGAVVHLRSDR